MTPAARVQAAIEILDAILDGDHAEKALTRWARGSRFAGSKDRAAVRDHVFQALRCLRSQSVLGGLQTGRGLLLGELREAGVDPETLFTGIGHAPTPLSAEELASPRAFASAAEACDIPDWLWPLWERSLGAEAEDVALALRQRAPTHLRVNLRKSNREAAIQKLTAEGIVAEPHAASATALNVTEGARKIRNCDSYLSGVVELQDAASQGVVDALPLEAGQRVLDYCAGGGGKTLAMAGRAELALFAHDAEPRRMKDLPERAQRAGVSVTCLSSQEVQQAAPFDVVLCDAPCSGSGSWRRDPEGKWRLTQAHLDEVRRIQAEILDMASQLVAEGGTLAYATCSMLDVENHLQRDAFLARHPGWEVLSDAAWHVHSGTDGFYVCLFQRTAAQ